MEPLETRSGESGESEHSYVTYRHENVDSSDVASFLVNMLRESDSGSMSDIRVESGDSSDDQSVIISDSDSNQMRRTSSSDSIDSVDDHLAEEPQIHASEQSPLMDMAPSSVVSADIVAASSTTGSSVADNWPQTSTSVDLNSSLDCFRLKKTKNALPVSSEDIKKNDSILEAGEDGEVWQLSNLSC